MNLQKEQMRLKWGKETKVEILYHFKIDYYLILSSFLWCIRTTPCFFLPFVESACSERDIVVTIYVRCMCMHASVRPNLSRS